MQFNNEHFVNLLQEEEEDLVESDEDEIKANQASHNKQWRKTSKTTIDLDLGNLNVPALF